ncbi:MAG: tyrosine-type recombinase/integrase [Betaproteobacteria bacterium]|nr:tyrosine-type recombinase/integrase [Betaproteobacteria bacterium]
MPNDADNFTINFTKTDLTKLVLPTEGRVEYKDTKVPGLRMRVSSTGVKTFCVYRWLKSTNRPERVTIGRFPEVSVEAARTKAAEIIAAFAMGESPNEAKRKARAEMAFGELFELYIERHAKPHNRTWREDASKFHQYLASNTVGIDLASKKLSAIERGDIAYLHTKIGKSHRTTANRVVALISSVFNRAIEWGIYNKPNPASRIKKFKENPRARFLQRDELPRFFSALAMEPNDVIRRFFLIALFTGARKGNVLTMRWDCLDVSTGTWIIPGSQSKNGAPLKVVLAPEALEVLKECKISHSSEWVFPGNGNKGHLVEPKKAWARLLDSDELTQLTLRLREADQEFSRKDDETLCAALTRARTLCESLGVDTSGTRMEGFRPHDLRRTLGSYQAITGASLQIIGKSLGHKSHAATQIYAHLDWDPVRESVNRATRKMLEAAGVQAKEEDAP